MMCDTGSDGARERGTGWTRAGGGEMESDEVNGGGWRRGTGRRGHRGAGDGRADKRRSKVRAGFSAARFCWTLLPLGLLQTFALVSLSSI